MLALIFLSHHKPSSPLYQTWAQLGSTVMLKRRICVRNAALAGRHETLDVTPKKFLLCSTNSHPAAQIVGLAVLIRSASPVAKYLVAEELEVYFALPGRSRESASRTSPR